MLSTIDGRQLLVQAVPNPTPVHEKTGRSHAYGIRLLSEFSDEQHQASLRTAIEEYRKKRGLTRPNGWRAYVDEFFKEKLGAPQRSIMDPVPWCATCCADNAPIPVDQQVNAPAPIKGDSPVDAKSSSSNDNPYSRPEIKPRGYGPDDLDAFLQSIAEQEWAIISNCCKTADSKDQPQTTNHYIPLALVTLDNNQCLMQAIPFPDSIRHVMRDDYVYDVRTLSHFDEEQRQASLRTAIMGYRKKRGLVRPNGWRAKVDEFIMAKLGCVGYMQSTDQPAHASVPMEDEVPAEAKPPAYEHPPAYESPPSNGHQYDHVFGPDDCIGDDSGDDDPMC